jgi:replicative DNA helicase
MKLSAPIYYLKRKAKLLSREENIPLHEALDRVAAAEGFRKWSLLSARASGATTAKKLIGQFRPGELVLLGSRPGHGKTLMGLQILIEAIKAGSRGVFFTLECSSKDVKELLLNIGVTPRRFDALFELDCSDEISAEFITKRMANESPGTVAVIDYLQLLDQQRQKPPLVDQVRTLKSFAREKGLIFIFLSQIDRSYDSASKPCPDRHDVRLPNPLDLSLFNKLCFLHAGEIQLRAAN